MKHQTILRYALVLALVAMSLAGTARAQSTTYYVDDSVGTSGDGLTPAAAFKTITEAFEAANEATTDTILIAGGTYQEADTIDMLTALTVIGSYDAAFTVSDIELHPTIMDCRNTIKAFTCSSETDWVLKNFVIRNSTTGAVAGVDSDDGGAIYFSGNNEGTMEGLHFIECRTDFEGGAGGAARQGGAFSARGGTFQVIDCLFENNFSVSRGGAINLRTSGNTMIIDRCVFRGNFAPGASVIHSDTGGDSILITNSIITGQGPGNSEVPLSGPLFDLAAGEFRLLNNTIVDNAVTNTGAQTGSIIRHRENGDAQVHELVNNIFVDNTSTNAFFLYDTPGDWGGDPDTLIQSNNIFLSSAPEPLTPTGGNVVGTNDNTAADPLFTDAANDDFTLLDGSPAIDTGAVLEDVTNDFNGDPRPGGDGYDLGAYEVQGPAFDCDTGLGEDATYSLDTTQLIVGTAGFTSLDGTWSHDNGGDEWDGSEIGGTLGAGNSPGGVSQIEDYLRIQDAGNPTGHGYADPGSNRKLSFVHDLFEEGATNSFLDDGCTVFFRARLATDGLLDSLHPDGGLIGPVPAEGDGYQIHDNGKGNVMLNQLSNTGYIGFALATDETNPAGGAGLLMNNLNGNAQTGDVDTEDAGTVNFIELDPTVWHNYWITIQADTTETGTHLVTAYVDCGDPQEFIVTIAGPDSLNAVNHVAIGAGSTPRSGAFDLAALMFAPTVIEPPTGGPSGPPNAASGWVLFD